MFAEIKGVLKHSVVYLAGSLAGKLVGFVMIPLYTHYLTTDQYGILELLDLTSYVVGLIMAMGVAQSVVRLYHDHDEPSKQNRVVSVAMITLWVVSAFSIVWLLYFASDASRLVFRTPDYYKLFQLIFVTVVLNLNIEIPMNLLLIKERSVIYNIINIVRMLINLSLNILFIVQFGMGVEGILLGGLLTSAVVGIFLTILTIRQIGLSFSFDVLWDMLKYGAPLIGSWLGMFVVNFGDRFILERLASLSDVGIYSLAYKFGMLPNILVLTPFMLIWAPKRFEIAKIDDAKRTYSYVFTYFLFAQLFIGLGISVLIKDTISIVSDADYHSAYMYVPVIILSYILWGCYSYTQVGILLEKRTKYLAYASTIGALVNVGANLLLIPRFGLWGASIATLLTFGILFGYVYNRSQALYRVPYQISRITKMTLTAAAFFVIAHFIHIPKVYVSLVVKFVLACLFPLALYLMHFFTDDEIVKAREGAHWAKEFLRKRVVPKIPIIGRTAGKDRH